MLKLKQTKTIKRSNKVVKIAEEVDNLLDEFNFPSDLPVTERFVDSILVNKKFVDFKGVAGLYDDIYDQTRTIGLKEKRKLPINKISELIIKIFLKHDIEAKKGEVKRFLKTCLIPKAASVVNV